jgi:hypothetical protein
MTERERPPEPSPSEWPVDRPQRLGYLRRHGERELVSDVRRAVRDLEREARQDAYGAGRGAVLVLERLFEVLAEVEVHGDPHRADLGHAVERLVDMAAGAPASEHERWRWLTRLQGVLTTERLWREPLEPAWTRWGDLCARPDLASRWADRLVRQYHAACRGGQRHRDRRTLCAGLSALIAAGRHEEVLAELALEPALDILWSQHGIAALVALGRCEEARALADRLRGGWPSRADRVHAACERAWRAAGHRDEAFERHAAPALLGGRDVKRAYLGLADTYPERSAEEIVRLIARHAPRPVAPLVALAADRGVLDFALELIARSPCLLKVVNPACRRRLARHPTFVLDAQVESLRALVRCPGSSATREEILDGHALALRAARATGTEARLHEELQRLLAGASSSATYLRRVLARAPEAPLSPPGPSRRAAPDPGATPC